jgi:D-3-phosphoglycerate dehydrogenase
MALLLAMARNVPQANADLHAGHWERKRYIGTELAGKVLGIVGLGRIGREVALRAQSFRMEVVGHDPFVTAEVAEDYGIHYMPLSELIPRADVLSLHVPYSAETRHMLNADVIAQMKHGSLVINCARGGLVDEVALVDAIESGHLAGAALDVFEDEPPTDPRLLENPRIITTPHLGASTREAQERVGNEIAEKIRDFLQRGMILDAVNFPSIARKEFADLGPVMDLAERLGSFLTQVTRGGIRRLEVRAMGSFGEHSLKPMVMAATKGLLSPMVTGGVSYVNALSLATERGITVVEGRSSESSPYSGLIRLTVETDKGSSSAAGTLFEPGRARMVEVDGVRIESYPAGHLLFFVNRDVPGVVGKIGNVLGEAHVNIAGIQLGRFDEGQKAVSIINVDSEVPDDALEQIRTMDEILEIYTVHV